MLSIVLSLLDSRKYTKLSDEKTEYKETEKEGHKSLCCLISWTQSQEAEGDEEENRKNCLNSLWTASTSVRHKTILKAFS